MGLPRNKIALIHVAVAQLGLGDDDYRLVLATVAGVRSSKELDDAGFRAVMDQLHRLGFESDRRKAAGFGRRYSNPDFATDGQVDKIRELWAEVTDGQGTEESLGKWLEGHFKVSSLRFVKKAAAQKIIPALMAFKKNKLARRARADP